MILSELGLYYRFPIKQIQIFEGTTSLESNRPCLSERISKKGSTAVVMSSAVRFGGPISG